MPVSRYDTAPNAGAKTSAHHPKISPLNPSSIATQSTSLLAYTVSYVSILALEKNSLSWRRLLIDLTLAKRGRRSLSEVSKGISSTGPFCQLRPIVAHLCVETLFP